MKKKILSDKRKLGELTASRLAKGNAKRSSLGGKEMIAEENLDL